MSLLNTIVVSRVMFICLRVMLWGCSWSFAQNWGLQARPTASNCPTFKSLTSQSKWICVMWKSQVPVRQRWILLSAHYSGYHTVCFVNTCPLHIDLCIWWIAFSTLSTTGLFFADTSTVGTRVLFRSTMALLIDKCIFIYCSRLTLVVLIGRDVNYCYYHVWPPFRL